MAGGVHPVRLADGRSGGAVGQGGGLLQCGVVQRERAVRRTEWLWPRADGLAGVDGPAGRYATDEVALAPEPFDARHHWSGSSRSISSKSLSALGALEVVERCRRETVVLSDR